MWKLLTLTFTLSIGLVTVSCSTAVPVPERFTPEIYDSPNEAWARVLSKYVDGQGAIDFKGVASSPEDLNAYVNWVSQAGPELYPERFPGLYAKLAFYLNSYNALSMYNVIDMGLPENLSGFMALKTFVLRSLEVSGGYTGLADYENHVIRPLGEERVHFALNCMVKGCPRLPKVPFTAEHLNAELDQAARLFLNEERNVRVNSETKTVYLSSILKFYTRDFTSKAGTLIRYVNRYRTQPISDDFRIEFIPYDWTLNAQKKGP